MKPEERNQVTDRLLDAALAHYSAAEPGLGMQARILANVRAEQERRNAWRVFIKVTAFAAAVVLVVVGSLLVRSPKSQPTLATNSIPVSAAPAKPQEVATERVRQETSQRIPVRSATRPNAGRQGRSAQQNKSAVPRQEQFPAPAPPTDQEYLLAAYLNATPANELAAIAADQQRWRDQVQRNANASEQTPAPELQINHLQASPLEGGSTTAGAPGAR